MMQAVLSFRRRFGDIIFPLFPRDRDFAAIHEVELIVTAPPEVEVTVADFLQLSPMIPDFLVNWRQRQADAVEALLRKWLDLPDDIRASDLAVGQFLQCGLCTRILEIHRAYLHKCKQPHRGKRRIYEATADEVTLSHLHIPFIPLVGVIQKLLKACGQDYRNVTTNDMDQLDMAFHCQTHDSDSRTFKDRFVFREIMNWRIAVRTICSASHRPGVC